MLQTISRHMMGFVTLSIEGEFTGRFIGLCIKNGIRFWHYQRQGERYMLSMRSADYRRLRAIRKRCPVKIKLQKKGGLPFRMAFFKKHPGLVVGFFVSAALYAFLTAHVWILTVSGTGEYTEQTILDAAEELGVFVGAARADFDEVQVANQLMQKLPHLEWATVNTENCQAEIVVKYSVLKPNIVDVSNVKNLVATKAGVIRGIEAQEGRVKVKIGQAVMPGDLLVSGIWDSNADKEEWLKTKDVKIFTASSRGRVMAETNRQFQVSLPEKETIYRDGAKAHRFVFGFFGLRIPFTPSFVSDGEYRRLTGREDLYVLETKLPLYVQTETLTRLYPQEQVIEAEDAKKRLTLLLEKTARDEMAEGDQILRWGEITMKRENGSYSAAVNCLCLENIAVEKKVLLK